MGNLAITDEILEKNRELVLDYIIAVGQKQYDKLSTILHDNFEYGGPITLHTAKDFIRMLKDHDKGVWLRNDVKAVFVDGNESYVIYDAVTDTRVGAVSVVECIKIANGKILSTRIQHDRHTLKKLIDEVAGF